MPDASSGMFHQHLTLYTTRARCWWLMPDEAIWHSNECHMHIMRVGWVNPVWKMAQNAYIPNVYIGRTIVAWPRCGWTNMPNTCTNVGLTTGTSTREMWPNRKPSGRSWTASRSSGLWRKWRLIFPSITHRLSHPVPQMERLASCTVSGTRYFSSFFWKKSLNIKHVLWSIEA